VLYSGAAPGLPGVNQFNFQIAPGTPDGCYVPLTVTYGNQYVTSFLSKTSDGLPCHHPFQLSVAAMQLLDRGGSIQIGEILMDTGIEAASSDRASRQESAQFLPLYLNAANMANYYLTGSTTQPCTIASPPRFVGAFGGGFDLGTITLRSAASTLTLPFASPPPADSPLNDLPPAVIAAGPWTANISGGDILPASSNLLSQFNAGAAGTVSVSVSEGGSGIPYADFSTSTGPLLLLVVWSSTDARPVDFQ
jgi:hypothetical protein